MALEYEVLLVEKIGGGGSQDAASIISNAERFAAEPNLKAVALSGPGGAYGRATNRMIALTESHRREEAFDDVMAASEEQFTTIARGLGNIGLANAVMDQIRTALNEGYGYAWIKMRPEFFIRSAYEYVLDQAGVQTNLVNPVNSVFVLPNGHLDIPRTYLGLQRELHPTALNLIVGFAARRDDLTMDNISRGSTDLVGAAASGALNQKYPRLPVHYILRKDDVMGIMRVSPKMFAQAKIADELSTDEVEALALGGAEVVHPAVLKLVDDTWRTGEGVLMEVKNTFDLSHPGTRIVPSARRIIRPEQPIAGIASQTIKAYKWKDASADNAIGSVAAVSSVFAKHQLPITDAQTGPGGVIETYISHAGAIQHAELVKDLESANGTNANVQVGGAQELIVLVGDALRTQAYLGIIKALSEVATAECVKIGSINHIDGEPSVSFTIPAGWAKGFIPALYRRFFDT